MDAIIQHCFPQCTAPGLALKVDDNASVWTPIKNTTVITMDDVKFNQSYASNQGMTAAGLMEAKLAPISNDPDGFAKQFVTTQGGSDLGAMIDAVKAQYGLHAAVGAAHESEMLSWDWADNHIALLLNMLRFAMLRRMSELGSGSLSVELPRYIDEEGLTIDRNQYFGEDYPAVHEWAWPGGTRMAGYPTFTALTDSCPSSDIEAIDLRALNKAEATVVLMMLGKWERKSRYRLDFSTDRLTEAMSYRSVYDLSQLNNWYDDAADGERIRAPELPSSNVIWNSLIGYVRQNRLFSHLSTALYLICCSAYQFLPATAEGQRWLGVPWRLSIPRFHAVRGRYTILTDGPPTLCSQRCMGEWGYVRSGMEQVNLAALTFAQAVQTGIAVRIRRRSLEENPTDIFDTEHIFENPTMFASAAAAEALGIKVPVPDAKNAYLWTDEELEAYDEERVVATTVDNALALGVRDYIEEEYTLTDEEAEVAADAEGEEDDGPEGEFRKRTRYLIRVPWFPMAGVPTYLMLIKPFTRYESPLALEGTISERDGQMADELANSLEGG